MECLLIVNSSGSQLSTYAVDTELIHHCWLITATVSIIHIGCNQQHHQQQQSLHKNSLSHLPSAVSWACFMCKLTQAGMVVNALRMSGS
jgi:hypothetical protein